jgi:N-acetylglucosaminyldiphosphoundecaprenol N-acetyl-beta-D-mannosaminyltransferase
MSQVAVLGNYPPTVPPDALPSFRVLDTRVDPITAERAILEIEKWIAAGDRGRCVALTNVNNVMEARHNQRFHAAMDAMDLSLPDGMPLAWLARRLGHRNARRIAGPDFVPAFCEATAQRHYRHYFYGSAPGIAEQMGENLKKMAPGMEIAGAFSPPFRALSAEEDTYIVEMINRAKPDVLWVGLGCPKQEYWVVEHRHRLNVPVILAVGQAFDIHAGVLKRAPRWMREHGLEWLFRLLSEPRRLWRRYLLSNSQFVFYVALEAARAGGRAR